VSGAGAFLRWAGSLTFWCLHLTATSEQGLACPFRSPRKALPTYSGDSAGQRPLSRLLRCAALAPPWAAESHVRLGTPFRVRPREGPNAAPAPSRKFIGDCPKARGASPALLSDYVFLVDAQVRVTKFALRGHVAGGRVAGAPSPAVRDRTMRCELVVPRPALRGSPHNPLLSHELSHRGTSHPPYRTPPATGV